MVSRRGNRGEISLLRVFFYGAFLGARFILSGFKEAAAKKKLPAGSLHQDILQWSVFVWPNGGDRGRENLGESSGLRFLFERTDTSGGHPGWHPVNRRDPRVIGLLDERTFSGDFHGSSGFGEAQQESQLSFEQRKPAVGSSQRMAVGIGRGRQSRGPPELATFFWRDGPGSRSPAYLFRGLCGWKRGLSAILPPELFVSIETLPVSQGCTGFIIGVEAIWQRRDGCWSHKQEVRGHFPQPTSHRLSGV